MERFSRLEKLKLKVVIRGIFFNTYFKLYKDRFIVKTKWYSLDKIYVSIEEFINTLAPKYFHTIGGNVYEYQAMITEYRKKKTLSEKIVFIYDWYIKLSPKISSTSFNSSLYKELISKQITEKKPSWIDKITNWFKNIFKSNQSELKKLQNQPSIAIRSYQKDLLEVKEQLMIKHRYGSISVSEEQGLIPFTEKGVIIFDKNSPVTVKDTYYTI